MKHSLLSCSVAWLLLSLPAFAADSDEGIAFFETKIRPVLVEACYSCHGTSKQQGNLRLDTKDAMAKGGDSGPAIVPGKPGESLLVKAIRHQDLEMPPKPKAKLPDHVIADFVRWIELGAPDPRDGKAVSAIDFAAARQFWSFVPAKSPPLPVVQNQEWAQSPIDHFILARLEAEKLKPVGPATKRVLIRRVTFDLTGLPPTPDEVQAFEEDDSPDAFARIVERLLSSPAYGERWGRHWLDVARYAEDQAHTFGTKPNSSAFRYRDWVVASINEDLAYDQFVKLQIAADVLPENAAAPDADRVRHLAALGFFGLGAQYYKDNTEVVKALADELDERVDTLSRAFLGLTVACARCHDHKFDPVTTRDYYGLAGIFNSSKLVDIPLASKDEVQRYQDGLKAAKAAEDAVKTFAREQKQAFHAEQAAEIPAYMRAVRAVQERRATDAKFGTKEQAKQDQLNAAALDRWFKYLEGNPKAAGLELWKQLPKPAEAVSQDALNAAAEAFAKQVQTAIADRAGKPTGEQTALLQAVFGDNGLFVLTDDELLAKLPDDKRQRMVSLRDEATRLRKEAPDKIEAKFPISHGIAEGTGADMKIYLRGNPYKPGDITPRRFLRVLAGDDAPRFDQGSGRRQLAEAIAAPDNPLTARVIVNRVWQWHFGRGIVGSASNFGQLGERPTHPELLDYLTSRFIESGWSLKSLHRELLLSTTYQLSSDVDEHNLTVDGDNRWLWRANRRRLDVESWRDALLAVSGRLDARLGGPTQELSASNNVRRTLYAKISRHELNGLLRLFDFPDANITSERRTETTVPQQQLFVLNSGFMADQAKAFAVRSQSETADVRGQIAGAFWRAYSRPASDAEIEVVSQFVSATDSSGEQNKLTRWERFAQALLGSNEFIFID